MPILAEFQWNLQWPGLPGYNPRRPRNELALAKFLGSVLLTSYEPTIYKLLTPETASRLTLEAMKLFRHIVIVVCIAASFSADADEQLTARGNGGTNQPTAVELQLLQGTWEGVLVDDKAQQKVTVTITGNSLHFHRDTNFWFETTITLPAGKNPKQLHATIKGCPPSQADSMGQVVRAFFKIEEGTLTLATMGDDAEETPKGFEAAGTRYELRKVQPQPQKKTEEAREPNTRTCAAAIPSGRARANEVVEP